LILSVVTMKGGSGKSTTAMCLAGYWHTNHAKVSLIDADPAATLMRWREIGEDFSDIPTTPVTDQTLANAVSDAQNAKRSHIIIDTPGFEAPVLRAAIDCSDVIIIPIRPSPVDFQIAADTAEFVNATNRKQKAQPLVCFLMTQSNRNSVIARHMRAEMTEKGYDLLEAQLTARVIYGETALAGSTPTFGQPRGIAAREIADLAREIDALVMKQSTASRSSR